MAWEETTSDWAFNASTSLQYPTEHTTSMEVQNVDEYYSCDVQYSPDRRWYLVAVAGTSLSVVSFICNLLIARILLRMKYSHFFFLGLLALSDAFLSFCYGPVIAMDVIKNRLQVNIFLYL